MRQWLDKRQVIATILLLLYIGFIIYLTLLCRTPSEYHQYNFKPFWSYQRFFDDIQPQGKQIILNVILFVPFGGLCSRVLTGNSLKAKKCLILTIVLAFVLSCIIEGVQFFCWLGFSEFDDVFDNTIGSCIGALLYILLRRISSQ